MPATRYNPFPTSWLARDAPRGGGCAHNGSIRTDYIEAAASARRGLTGLRGWSAWPGFSGPALGLASRRLGARRSFTARERMSPPVDAIYQQGSRSCGRAESMGVNRRGGARRGSRASRLPKRSDRRPPSPCTPTGRVRPPPARQDAGPRLAGIARAPRGLREARWSGLGGRAVLRTRTIRRRREPACTAGVAHASSTHAMIPTARPSRLPRPAGWPSVPDNGSGAIPSRRVDRVGNSDRSRQRLLLGH